MIKETLRAAGLALLILIIGTILSIILLKLFGANHTIYGIIIAFTIGGFGSVGFCAIKQGINKRKKQIK